MKASLILGYGLTLLCVSQSVSAQPLPSSPYPTRTFQHSSGLPSMAQINSVSNLSDVQPTDWAYEALRSLVERYGCIVGYPNATFRGNQSLTRWEFAAGLNACLNTIERLLQENVAVLEEDIDKLKRLAEDFASELTALGTRIENLENRVAFLEDHQFSTTTKLLGGAVISFADVYGKDNSRNEAVLQYRVNLNSVTSFTGRDLLVASFFSGNAPLETSFNLAATEIPTPLGFSIANETAEGTLSSQFAANTGNKLKLLALQYTFPVGEKLRFDVLSSLSTFHPFVPTLNPLFDDNSGGKGSLSEFGQRNPIYAATAGGTGLILNYKILDNLKLSGGYLADGLFAASNPEAGRGLFNGDYGAIGQLTWDVTDTFSLAGIYGNAYNSPGRFGFNYNGLGVSGTGVANSLAGQDLPLGDLVGVPQFPVISNGYGVNFSWQANSSFVVNGWFSTVYSRLIGQGDGNILTYAVNFGFPDVGKEGNLLGFVVGAQPYLTHFRGGNPQPFEVDVPWHLEGFYRYSINDRIAITPGFIWLLNPNQDSQNSTDLIGTVRTTFAF